MCCVRDTKKRGQETEEPRCARRPGEAPGRMGRESEVREGVQEEM